jgi:site-specific DNA-methyltransferase (adenine-specific)
MADKRLGAEREVIERNPNSRENCDKSNTIYESGTVGKTDYLTTAKTEQAKALEGWYSYSPKPAVELIVIAQKPSGEKTLIDCALKSLEDDEYAVGGVNFDACRIPILNGDELARENKIDKGMFGIGNNNNNKAQLLKEQGLDYSGRFPSHLICADDALNDGELTKSGWDNNDNQQGTSLFNIGNINPNEKYGNHYNDEGSKSRYYDIDAWFLKNVGKLPKEAQLTFPCLQVAKPSKSEKNKGLEEFEEKEIDTRTDTGKGSMVEKGLQPQKNNHPTTKPITLFSYLIKLFARPDKVILDPFAGSGTTLCACELLNQPYIAFEREAEYVEIARARVKYWSMTELERESYDKKQDKLKKAEANKKQKRLFE